MNFTRVWAMPNSDTFDVPPIGEFVKKYLRVSKVSVDPFSRNKRWATYTNDLNPNTESEYHMDASEFLSKIATSGVRADLVIFDPPYSIGQANESYAGVGIDKRVEFAGFGSWTKEKDIVSSILSPGGHFLHFGWHSNGLGQKRGSVVEEVLLVAHGGGHYDTICLAELKISHQAGMFS